MRINKRVGAIVVKEGKILLIHRFKNGREYWTIVGGGVEDEETNEEALKREIKEETNLDLLNCNLLGTDCDENGCNHFHFNCVLSDGIPEIVGPEKDFADENNVYILEWVPINKIKDLILYPISAKQYIK